MSRKDVQEVSTWDLEIIDSQPLTPKETTDINNNKEEINMRRYTEVHLIDDDKGLPVDMSLVTAFTNVMTEDDDEVTIREVLMTCEVANELENHNLARGETIDESILKHTGNEVFLRPVKLKDLRWVVK